MGMHMKSWVDWGFKGLYAKAERLKAAALRAGSVGPCCSVEQPWTHA